MKPIKRTASSKRLVGIFAVTRHDRAIMQPGRWANENQYPLSLPGLAHATRHGERFIEVLKRNPSIWRQIRARGLFYTGIASPLQRAVETDQANFLGISAKLSDEGIHVQGHHHVQNPSLALVNTDKRFRQYPKTRKAQQNIIGKMEQYGAGKSVPSFESQARVREKMHQVTEVADIFRLHGKELTRGSPVYFLNFVSHGGEKGIPIQVDYAVEALTGIKVPVGKALQRGQSVIQLVYSDGTRRTIQVRK